MSKKWEISTKIKKSDIFTSIMENRGIDDIEEFLFINQKYENSPFVFKQMNKAVEAISDAIDNNKRILVVADTDTDGVTSGYMVFKYIREFSEEVAIIIGTGKKHGLSQFDINLLLKYDLIIACDSLSSEHDIYKYLNENGVKIVLADHHFTEEVTKDAILINSEMEDYPNKNLSGSGVALKLIEALNYEYGIDISEYSSYASIGIIADICSVGLDSLENRSICNRGFQNLKNVGILEILGSYQLNSTSISYSIAPLINSAMRTERNNEILDIFMSKTKKNAKNVINSIKDEKRALDELKNVEISTLLASQKVNKSTILFRVQNVDNLLKNYTGVIASAIANDLGRPVIVLNPDLDKNGNFYGSMRSIGNFNFRDLINDSKLAFSAGHETSAGVFIKPENLDIFSKYIDEKILGKDFESVNFIDAIVKESDIDWDLAYKLREANRISGKGFPSIKIGIKNLRPEYAEILKGIHSKLSLRSGIEAFLWNNTEIAKDFINEDCEEFDICGNVDISTFMGLERINFIIEDFIPKYDFI